MSRKRGASSPRWLGYGEVPSSLLLIFPLFLAYELGLLVTPASNGVDFISRMVFDAVDRNAQHYLYVHLALGAVFLGLLTILWRRNALAIDRVAPMLLESVIYALTLGSFIIFVMDWLVGLDLLAVGFTRLSVTRPEVGNALVVALGAGVHEELVFRLGLMGIGGLFLQRCGLTRPVAILVAALASSLLFALAHHVGATGEAFEISLFVYRAIAGLAFAAIFYYRSLAHAAYSHFLYDFYVLVIAR